jgi:hypothetical protein
LQKRGAKPLPFQPRVVWIVRIADRLRAFIERRKGDSQHAHGALAALAHHRQPVLLLSVASQAEVARRADLRDQAGDRCAVAALNDGAKPGEHRLVIHLVAVIEVYTGDRHFDSSRSL